MGSEQLNIELSRINMLKEEDDFSFFIFMKKKKGLNFINKKDALIRILIRKPEL